MNVTQQDAPTGSRSERPRAMWVLAVVVTLAGAGGIGVTAQSAGRPALSGSWTLQESTGDLPDQAVRAFDGSVLSAATIDIEQSDDDVSVRRITPHAVLLRVMLLQPGERDSAAVRGAVLTAHARWQDRTLVARGDVTLKQGFLKRRVPYEEEWRVDEGERMLTVTLTVKTPRGVKRRTQVFARGDRAVSTAAPRRTPSDQKNLATK